LRRGGGRAAVRAGTVARQRTRGVRFVDGGGSGLGLDAGGAKGVEQLLAGEAALLGDLVDAFLRQG
jgi:hypothetical protein